MSIQLLTSEHLLGTAKIKTDTECCAIFDFRSACWLEGFTKTFNGDFQLCLPLQKVRVNSCIDVDVYIYIYVIYIDI